MTLNIPADGLVISSVSYPIVRDRKSKQQKKTNQINPDTGKAIREEDPSKPEIYEVTYNDGRRNKPHRLSLDDAKKMGLDVEKENQLIGKKVTLDVSIEN